MTVVSSPMKALIRFMTRLTVSGRPGSAMKPVSSSRATLTNGWMDEPVLRHAVREPRHHVADPHLLVDVLADLQAPGVGEDHVAAVKPAGVDAEIDVADPGAEAQAGRRRFSTMSRISWRETPPS